MAQSGRPTIDVGQRRGEIGDVAEAEVEPLRADRREGVRRLRRPARRHRLPALSTVSVREQETCAPASAARCRRTAAATSRGTVARSSSLPPACAGFEHVAVVDPDQVGAVAAGGHQGERALRIVELDRGAAERAAELEVADQRRLGEAVLAGAEAGRARGPATSCRRRRRRAARRASSPSPSVQRRQPSRRSSRSSSAGLDGRRGSAGRRARPRRPPRASRWGSSSRRRGRPASVAANSVSGARISRSVASMMRIWVSGWPIAAGSSIKPGAAQIVDARPHQRRGAPVGRCPWARGGGSGARRARPRPRRRARRGRRRRRGHRRVARVTPVATPRRRSG